MNRWAWLVLLALGCGGEGPLPETGARFEAGQLGAGLRALRPVLTAPSVPAAAPPPFISRFSPERGQPGTLVQILGDFPAPARCAVTIGGQRVPVLDTPHVLTVRVEDDTYSGPVCVTARGRTSCGEWFTVVPRTTVTSLSPQRVLAGAEQTEVTLRGEGFARDAYVELDGVRVLTACDGNTQLRAFVPATALASGARLGMRVVVPATGGVVEDLVFWVDNPSPAAERVEPLAALDEQARVAVFGSGFVPSSSVRVDGVVAPTVFVSSERLEAVVGSSLGRSHDVQVESPAPGGGLSALLSASW